MIFSVSNSSSVLKLEPTIGTDYLCSFDYPNSIKCPDSEWFGVLKASLRSKKNVLMIDSCVQEMPIISTNKRFLLGEGWMWFAPRSLSTVTTFSCKNADWAGLRLYLSSINP